MAEENPQNKRPAKLAAPGLKRFIDTGPAVKVIKKPRGDREST